MVEVLQSMLFGAVQGLTEFLPISSSGHLLLLHSIADVPVVNELAFDVALHVGTLLAVVVYFRNDLVRLGSAWFRSFQGQHNPDGRLVWLILLGTLPAALAGWWLESRFESWARQPQTVAIALVLGGLMLWLVDRRSRHVGQMESITLWPVLAIGLGQAVALIPGVSRSGATITMGRLLGLGREAAARFSFLLSIPIIVGAGLKQGINLIGQTIDASVFLTGIVSAAVIGYLAIGWLLALVQRRSYAVFAVYRIALGVVVWFYFFGQ